MDIATEMVLMCPHSPEFPYKQYCVNKTEQETPFSEKPIKFRPRIVYIFFLSFEPSPTTVKRMALISLPPYIYIYIYDHMFGIVVNTFDCHPRGPGFDSRLYPRIFSGGRSIGSGTGSTQPREDNWVAT